MIKAKKAGILIPVFSLRTKEGFGIGEFLDLILLADLAEQGGFALIQLLPVFDTSITKTWLDSYCYSVVSMFAVHPIYLRIEKAFSEIPDQILAEIRVQKDFLNQLEELDYEKVYQMKIDFCKRLYALEGKSFISSSVFIQFMEESKTWLFPYAAFSVLRDIFGSSDFSKWGKYKKGTKEIVDEICNESSQYYEKICFYYFLQFQLHLQFEEASLYAKAKGISLKGDYPVGVHVHSVETWVAPELFVLDKRIGAPPDYFNTKGQNWELPAYNWEEVKKSSYNWFIRRLKHMERYCQLVRIDHILGYFRFWEISDRCSRGALGFFNPSLSIPVMDMPKDISRYRDPFITDPILDNYFQKNKNLIVDKFFEKKKEGLYCFKEFYQNQKSIDLVKDISKQEREFLHELYENVILVQDVDKKDVFYPRIGFENTLSFAFLSEEEKEHCKTFLKVYSSEDEEKLWEKEGMEKLSCFQKGTSMEICAEDLGMLPKCTEEVLEKVGFLRLHIQRMPKKKEDEFSLPLEYEYLSVCSPSNHDTSTLRMWWKEDSQRTQRFYQNILQQEGEAPSELSEFLCEKIIQMHLESGSKWAVFTMQDLLAMSPTLKRKEAEKERINDPSIYPFYWRWRLHINLEDLIAEKKFFGFLHSLLARSGRLSNFLR